MPGSERCLHAAVWFALALSNGGASAAEPTPITVPFGGRIEHVTFADPRHPGVRVIRGPSQENPSQAMPSPATTAQANPPPLPGLPGAATSQIVSFGGPRAGSVRVLRGPSSALVAAPPAAAPRQVETVKFETAGRAVTVVRGAALAGSDFGLFGPANGGELDRIAFAVDGVESRHGADLRMWRPEWSGPQGPMQVSAAAALDVGGGDRFDIGQNRVLGRAYLARMYQRYGNWPDAVAAYNWGPGNLDGWIARGRSGSGLPVEVVRYVERVLRDTLTARFQAQAPQTQAEQTKQVARPASTVSTD